MLRNSYFEWYQKDKKRKSEYEKMIMNYDGEQILFLDRPLSMTNIKKISENDFPIFVNDLMCEKGTGHLLFPASFRNQVNLYLKQQSYAYKVTTFNKNKNFIEMMKELKRKRNKELEGITNMKKLTSPKLSNLKKREELEEMKVNLNSLKNRRSKLIKNLRNKSKKFYKSQPLINRKLRKLMFQSVNDIRIRGFEKAFEACNNLSLTHKDFNMPDISVNEFNVFSRLYNNIISRNKTRNLNNKSQNYETRYNDHQNHINIHHSVSLIKNNKIESSLLNQNENQLENKGFIVPSINKKIDGKEFIKRVTSKMYKKCLFSFSCGPKDNLENEDYKIDLKYNYNSRNRMNNSIKYKKGLVNYYAKLTSKNCFLKMKKEPNIKKGSHSMDSDKINALIIANSNSKIDLINIKKYRDSYYNTNLHRSVLKNNAKFVEYFIKKNDDVNKKNKNGDTPLHLAFKIGNYEIIRLLLENGANLKIKNKKGYTPFDIANKEIRTDFNLGRLYNGTHKKI